VLVHIGVLCAPLVFGSEAKQEKPNKKIVALERKKKGIYHLFPIETKQRILKQNERKIKQNKRSGTKNVEQNNAKNLFESKKKEWKRN
jgi:hypothetical protein